MGTVLVAQRIVVQHTAERLGIVYAGSQLPIESDAGSVEHLPKLDELPG